MKVINLFAGPGAGKSTTAAGLFYLMKSGGYRVELVTEFAKDLTYEKGWDIMSNQLAILGEQDRRLQRLVGQVDYAITDSPLLLGLAYSKGRYAADWFTQAVVGAFDSYDNTNFFIQAVKPYQPYGRRQSEASARSVDSKIRELLSGRAVKDVRGDAHAPLAILNSIQPMEPNN